MKVNLLINGYPLNGYLNLDPMAQPNESVKVNHSLENLDDIIDNNECTEFLANGVIDTFPIGARAHVLGNWMAKIEHNGIFVLSGMDINKVARLISLGDIDTNNANNLLFGPCNNMWNIKKGIWSMQNAVDAILASGQFTIVSKSFDGLNYIIRAKRI